MDSIMVEIFNNIVLDNLGKEWPCSLETTEDGTVIAHINGYSDAYPLILSRDITFITNINKNLIKLGVNRKVSVSLSERDDTVEFSTDNTL
jgi:hypothetical protein